MFEEQESVEQIEISSNGQIGLKVKKSVLKDGKVIASNIHRDVLSPGDDVSHLDERTQAIANLLWTQEVIDAYKNFDPLATINETL